MALYVPVMGQENEQQLIMAFKGAQKVDLRASKVSSVVTLRTKIGIAPPSTPVFVKVFDRKSLPAVLQPLFAREGSAGVTINGRYIAILRTPLRDEYADILGHELVHAYITLASPAPLPLWFQEGCAVHLSMGKDVKFYGQASDSVPGMMVGRTVQLPEDYKRKLQSVHFLLETVGEKKFNEWVKRSVETGEVDARPLLGLESEKNAKPARSRKLAPIWFALVAGVVMIGVVIAAYYSSKRNGDYF